MLELADGRSMKEVYGSGSGFYQALVKAASCSEIRTDDGNWKSKLRFLTPDYFESSAQHGSSSLLSGEREECWCAKSGYKAFTGSDTSRLRLTDFGEVTECSHYVAVSYCWKNAAAAAAYADGVKSFDIVTSNGIRKNRAPYGLIRRAIAYAAYRTLPFIWIDQECIEQDDEVEKQSIIKHMDRIYRQARHVVALTTTMICESKHLQTIDAVRRSHHNVAPADKHDLAKLLDRDEWFDRAWTLQENVVSARMVDFLLSTFRLLQASFDCKHLIIGHGDILMTQQMVIDLTLAKDKNGPFLTTRLKDGYTTYKEEDLAPNVDVSRHRLSAFHALSLVMGKALSVPSDRLSIVANMSAYKVRLDYLKANKAGLDIDTCVFAQAILNGDMSLILAYRFFTYAKNKMLRSRFQVSPSYSLSSAMQGWPTEEDRYCADFRCRILPLSIESRGFRVRGQLWT